MKRNLIKTDSYLLVVDESVKEIKNGEYFLLGGKHVNMWAGSGNRIMTELTCKIISHAPLNGAPYIDGVYVLPPNWRDSGEKHEYKEEDLKNAFYNGWLYRGEKGYQYPKALNEFIQSLQQPKYPIAFECEVEAIWVSNLDRNAPTKDDLIEVPKTIVNSEGRTEWVGKYIYE